MGPSGIRRPLQRLILRAWTAGAIADGGELGRRVRGAAPFSTAAAPPAISKLLVVRALRREQPPAGSPGRTRAGWRAAPIARAHARTHAHTRARTHTQHARPPTRPRPTAERLRAACWQPHGAWASPRSPCSPRRTATPGAFHARARGSAAQPSPTPWRRRPSVPRRAAPAPSALAPRAPAPERASAPPPRPGRPAARPRGARDAQARGAR
jgi:hypothetical protein